MNVDQPLVYPSHYPPSRWRQRFFIGVRWLGPDLSFFKELRAIQASRTPASMICWGGGSRQDLATQVSAIFAQHLRWPSAFFLPGDQFGVITGGPSFDVIDGTADANDALGEIEKRVGIRMPKQFWQGAEKSSTLGSVVDQMLEAGARAS